MSKNVYSDLLTTDITLAENGVTYKVQRMPLKAYLDLNDRCRNSSGILQQGKFGEELLKACVIAPKVTLKDFEYDYEAGLALVSDVEAFLRTKSEQKTGTAEGEGQ